MANAATVGAKSMTVIMVARFCLWVASASFIIFVISKAYQLFKNINLEILIRTNEGNKKWWARLDLNQRPSGYEPPALTTELQAPACIILIHMKFRYLEIFLVPFAAAPVVKDAAGVELSASSISPIVDLVVAIAVITALTYIAVIVAARHARRAIVRRSSRLYTKTNETAKDQADHH